MGFDETEKWWNDHFREYVEDLKGFVEIPSIAKKDEDGYPFGRPCHDMLLYISSLMERYGLDVSIINDVFAKGSYNKSAKKTIAIACHGDVVPVGEGWERSPFELFEKEDHLVGRGTTDNKGATIAVLYALRFLKECGYKSRHDFALLVGSAEEIGMHDVPIAFPNGNGAMLTLVPDSGFPLSYGEKASLKVSTRIPLVGNTIKSITAGLGTGVIDRAECVYNGTASAFASDGIEIDGNIIVSKGKARHSATPEGGECAFSKLLKYLDKSSLLNGESSLKRLIDFFPDFYGTGLGVDFEDEESGRLSAVITKVETKGHELFVTINFRFPSFLKPEELFEKVKEKLPLSELSSSSSGYKTELTKELLAINEISNRIYSADRKPYIMAGGTYARVMQPAVAFGMGSPLGNKKPPFEEGEGRAHQRNESVDIDRMKKGFMIYSEALRYLDGVLADE